MKTTFRFISMLSMAAIALTACQEKEPIQPIEGTTYTFAIAQNDASKAVVGEKSFEWEAGDQIGTYAGGINNNAGNVNIGNPCTFTVKTATALTAGDRIYAYATYAAAAGENPAEAVLEIPAEQNGEGTIAMPMAATPYVVSGAIEPGTNPVGQIYFNNLAALARFQIYSDGTVAAGEKILSVTFEATSALAGKYTVDLTAIDPAVASTLALGTAATPSNTVVSTLAAGVYVPATKENAVVCYMVVAPGTYSGTITVETDKAAYEKTVTALALGRNVRQPLGFNLSTATRKDTTPTFVFDSPAAVTFDLEQSQTVNFTTTNVATVEAPASMLTGWTLSNIQFDAATGKGSVDVIAPASMNAETGNTPAGDFGLVATSTKGEQAVIAENQKVRMRGVNSLAEFKAFRKAYCPSASPEGNINSKTTTVTTGEVEKYLVGGKLVLNADVTIANSDMVYSSVAYFMKRLFIDFDGRGHTITYNNVSGTANLLAFFQVIHGNVSNLNFDGKLTSTLGADNADYCVAALAAKYSKDLTFENIKVTTAIEVKKISSTTSTNCFAGLIARYASDTPVSGETYSGTTVTFKNCEMAGAMTINQTSGKDLRCGGILGHCNTANTAKGTFDHCKFTGSLSITSTAQNGGSRYGGIIGNNERMGDFLYCEVSAPITVDAKSSAIPYDCVGALIGRRASKNPSYPNIYMDVNVENCNISSIITINNSSKVDATRKKNVGLIVGFNGNADDGVWKVVNTTPTGEINWN